MSVHVVARESFVTPREQLRAELSLLDVLLRRHILRLRAAQLLNESDFRGLYISDEEVDSILRSSGGANADAPEVSALTQHIEEQRRDLASRASAPPLEFLQRKLSLDRFAIELLVVAVAAEVDLKYQSLFAYAQNDVTRKLPSIDLALQLLCRDDDERIDRRDAFVAEAPLIRERLIQVVHDGADRDTPWLAHSVRSDARVADFLLGRDALDPRLASSVRRLLPSRRLFDLPLEPDLLQRIRNLLPLLADGPALVVIRGPAASERAVIAESMAAQLGLSVLTLDVTQLAPAVPLADVMPLLRREALLGGDAIVLDRFDAIGGDDAAAVAHRALMARELLSFGRPLFVIASDRWPPDAAFRNVPVYDIAIETLSVDLRARCWNDALGDDRAGIDVDALADRFALTPLQIRSAVADARAALASRSSTRHALTTRDVVSAAHAQSGHGLRRLATRVALKQGWEDLVLPSRATQQLRDLCSAVRFRSVVYERWDFQRRFNGRGMSVLFSGPSGTGKTLAASIVARDLDLEMYKVDLSAVVSKYIGETEKNLNTIFTEAQTSNAILFFDEADALFGKRSEVKDAHDRYANIEIAFLLQRIEAYDGVVVLATNLSRNIDEAFARRMFDTIEFPLPNAEQRERIWRTMLSNGAPLSSDIDYAFLGRQFELAGGNIRNAVVLAAFSAAATSASIGMRDLVIAIAREMLKIGRLPSRGEFRDFYDVIRDMDALTGPAV